ncbi:hypothetical protein WKW80_07295 [Variovorax humicola]|uniref:O-GlcNAc transferase C-terminal domain-containing protein n=1 Tax=Variovorax humicola TaxID=1769758 RepID=A0ABU8VX75_9BURK
MLGSLVRRFLVPLTGNSRPDPQTIRDLYLSAKRLFENHDIRAAQAEYQKYLEYQPHDVDALNDYACCLAAVGMEQAAAEIFEKAFALNDAFFPVVTNYANLLKSKYKTEESLKYLAKARLQSPYLANIRTVYGAILFSRGSAASAAPHNLAGWLSKFDDLRQGNSYLFSLAYCCPDEALLATEHRFWAETLKPLEVEAGRRPSSPQIEIVRSEPRKIRIGYWSPDLQAHSVNFFFRPLLEGHDKNQFEIFIYHDAHKRDEQTDLVEQTADQFFSVAEFQDVDLRDLILSHDLDVLVEMAGHSSSNRLNLLQARLAKLQVTGIGYPPTTGLNTIDLKMLDVHMVDGAESARYYSERIAVLPRSFWCYDPMAPVVAPSVPPCTANGFITFGCVGNLAKITPQMMRCWAEILFQVPRSRLLLRAINFNDPAAQDAMLSPLLELGISRDRIDIRKPEGGDKFSESYSEIDVILDTYPFNGGTTSCFATYMGVPIVTMAGKSLVSRMGESIMNNLGLADWVVRTPEEYVSRAVRAAVEMDCLPALRAEMRQRFQQSALGDRNLFARDFEHMIRHELNNVTSESNQAKVSSVGVLPEDEIIRRAYYVLRSGQFDAARRIVDHCLAHYPTNGAANVLWTERLTSKGKFQEAADYLERTLPIVSQSDHAKVAINLSRLHLLLDRADEARRVIENRNLLAGASEMDRLQLRQIAACIRAGSAAAMPANVKNNSSGGRTQNVEVLIFCDDSALYQLIADDLTIRGAPPASLKIHVRQLSEGLKLQAYEESLDNEGADYKIWIQKNVRIFNTSFWVDLMEAMNSSDLLSVTGAQSWRQSDWRLSAVAEKSGSLIIPSGEKKDFYEVQFFGNQPQLTISGVGVLGGEFLVLKSGAWISEAKSYLESELEQGGTHLEDYFSHAAAAAGARLAVHQCLGVSVDWRVPLDEQYLGEARMRAAELLGINAFDFPEENNSALTVPVRSVDVAVTTQKLFLERGA